MQTNIYLTIITIMSTSCLMNPSHHFTHPYPHKYFYNAKKKSKHKKNNNKRENMNSDFDIYDMIHCRCRIEARQHARVIYFQKQNINRQRIL